MRPIFCGNFEYDARQSELERLFSRYGKVDRVDMKSGISGEPIFFLDDEVASPFLPVPEPHLLAYFQELIRSTMLYGTVHLESFSRFAFIYMEDERDAEDAIRALDRTEFGRQGRRLRVEWTKQERGGGGGRRSGSSRRSPANMRPTKTLFVINFDPINTRTRDLERHFEPYGKILNVRIRRNFAFIHFEDQEDASKALEATNMSKLLDRIISVEYAIRDDDDKRNGYSPERRGRDRSLERRGRDNGRSPSPYGRGRERDSPDYGRGSSPYNKLEKRSSPNYGRAGSPGYERDSPRQERE